MSQMGSLSFDSDDAMDWLADLRDGDPSMVHELLTEVAEMPDDEYIELNLASPAMLAAELVAAAHGAGIDRLYEDAIDWVNENREVIAAIPLELVRRAVARVMSNSELQELWDDQHGPDSEWRQDMRGLVERLG